MLRWAADRRTLGFVAIGFVVAAGCSFPEPAAPPEPLPDDRAGFCPGRQGLESAGPGPSAKSAPVYGPAIVDLSLEIGDAAWQTLLDVHEACSGLHRCEELDGEGDEPCCDSDLRKTWVPATFRFDAGAGESTQSHVRLKGNPRDWKLRHELQFVIRFNETDPDGRFLGLRRLNLDANPADDSLIRNNVGMYVMRSAGLAASRTNHARLWIDGQVFGIYESIEAVDREFLEDRFSDPTGNLYKHGDERRLKTNEDAADHTGLWAIYDAFENPPAWLPANLDCLAPVDQWLRLMAAEVLLPAGDNVVADDYNFYLYLDPRGGAALIPWDLDDIAYPGAGWATHPTTLAGLREDGDSEAPGAFFAAMMEHGPWRERLLAELGSLIESTYRSLPGWIEARCCALRPDVQAEAGTPHPRRPVESYRRVEDFDLGCAVLRDRVRCRADYLDAVLSGEPPPSDCSTSAPREPIPCP